MNQNLSIVETREGDAHVLALSGRLDALSAPLLDTKAGRITAASPSAHVVVDMAECEGVSSAGLRVIVAMQKRASAGGSLSFRNVGPHVMDVLRATGFEGILTFE